MNVVISAFKCTVKMKFWGYFLWGIGPCTILLIGKDFFNLSIKQSVFAGVAGIVILFSLRYLFFLFIYLGKFIHNTYVDSIWGQAIVDLKEAYSVIHRLRKNDELDDREFMQAMILFCTTLKKIFDRKTKGNCCVSIKVPIGQNGSLESLVLKNLCRDAKHSERDTQTYQEIPHTVIGNTPYRFIVTNLLKKKSRYSYVNNDILRSKDYQNTSTESYKDGILPYKSELVYPIIPIIDYESDNLYNMIGFICIDCDKPNVFDEQRYDIPMVQGIADGIYDIILKRNQQ